MSPGKVAEALRYLAKRAGDAEKGVDEAARERGLRSVLLGYSCLTCDIIDS